MAQVDARQAQKRLLDKVTGILRAGAIAGEEADERMLLIAIENIELHRRRQHRARLRLRPSVIRARRLPGHDAGPRRRQQRASRPHTQFRLQDATAQSMNRLQTARRTRLEAGQ